MNDIAIRETRAEIHRLLLDIREHINRPIRFYLNVSKQTNTNKPQT